MVMSTKLKAVTVRCAMRRCACTGHRACYGNFSAHIQTIGVSFKCCSDQGDDSVIDAGMHLSECVFTHLLVVC
jgi:hypothetical protein